jgi:hypothetical protein
VQLPGISSGGDDTMIDDIREGSASLNSHAHQLGIYSVCSCELATGTV